MSQQDLSDPPPSYSENLAHLDLTSCTRQPEIEETTTLFTSTAPPSYRDIQAHETIASTVEPEDNPADLVTQTQQEDRSTAFTIQPEQSEVIPTAPTQQEISTTTITQEPNTRQSEERNELDRLIFAQRETIIFRARIREINNRRILTPCLEFSVIVFALCFPCILLLLCVFNKRLEYLHLTNKAVKFRYRGGYDEESIPLYQIGRVGHDRDQVHIRTNLDPHRRLTLTVLNGVVNAEEFGDKTVLVINSQRRRERETR